MKLVVANLALFLAFICMQGEANTVVWRPQPAPQHTQCDENDPNVSEITETEFIEFEKFWKAYNKQYRNYSEFQKRFSIFKRNLKIMQDNVNNGMSSEINQFSDKTEVELRCMLSLGIRPQVADVYRSPGTFSNAGTLEVNAGPQNSRK